jgi:hypothetical protein
MGKNLSLKYKAVDPLNLSLAFKWLGRGLFYFGVS